MKLEFWVTICLSHDDGGDVSVEVDVSDEEYELLKQCCIEYEDINTFNGLEDLYDRVVSEAKDLSEDCVPEGEDAIDFDDVSFSVAIPDSIYDEAQEDD